MTFEWSLDARPAPKISSRSQWSKTREEKKLINLLKDVQGLANLSTRGGGLRSINNRVKVHFGKSRSICFITIYSSLHEARYIIHSCSAICYFLMDYYEGLFRGKSNDDSKMTSVANMTLVKQRLNKFGWKWNHVTWKMLERERNESYLMRMLDVDTESQLLENPPFRLDHLVFEGNIGGVQNDGKNRPGR